MGLRLDLNHRSCEALVPLKGSYVLSKHGAPNQKVPGLLHAFACEWMWRSRGEGEANRLSQTCGEGRGQGGKHGELATLTDKPGAAGP